MSANIFPLIRNFLARRKQSNSGPNTSENSTFNIEEYIAKQLKEAGDKAILLEKMFGKDFLAFFYGNGKNFPLPYDLLNSLGFSEAGSIALNNDYWEDKNPFNFPGPFYTGITDNAATGDSEAPYNVMYDSETMEFVYRQPASYIELIGVINAGAVEVYDGYSWNGNSHWTYTECKHWWANKDQLINNLLNPEVNRSNAGREKLYINYLNTEAEKDLRKYCYFLENNIYPPDDNTTLPSLL